MAFFQSKLEWTPPEISEGLHGDKRLVHYLIYFVYNIISYHRQINNMRISGVTFYSLLFTVAMFIPSV
jgi:hypothetical protein